MTPPTKHPIPLPSATQTCTPSRSLDYVRILIVTFLCLFTPIYDTARAQPLDTNEFSTVNIRLSSKPIRPPQDLLITTLKIPNIELARPIVGPPSKSAILESDQRHRIVVLTTENNGDLTVYVLDHIDLTSHLEHLRILAARRGCAHDRMTITGGLGCVAISLKEIIEAELLP
ncbi:MAG: hypothetical protein NPIRA02_40350 [Nitrospirales bacterium]|nr:MAG: hypothetical protein NPIRA02_40350 [Nitrospirales bacterium]